MRRTRRHYGRPVGRAVSLIRTGLTMCVTVAALSYPFATMVGFTVKVDIDELDIRSQQLPEIPPPQTSRLYASDGTTLIAEFHDANRAYTPLARIAPTLVQAIVAAEDPHFYDRHGTDLTDVARTFVADHRSGGAAPDASPLTLEYARDVLLDSARTPQELQAATEQTAARTLRERQLAVTVEQKLTRPQILERYLNIAYFGHQAYGIAAAATVYFATSPADLTLPEAAMLAGLVQAPSAYDPAGDPAAAAERRDLVLDRMVDRHDITRAAAEQARAQPIALRLSERPDGCAATANASYGFFCDLFLSWWTRQPAFGPSPAERLSRLRRGGYRIVASLDATLQAGAYRHVLADEPAGGPVTHGLVAVEPGTGRVRAMVADRAYPDPVAPLLGGDPPGLPAGSAFPLFTMLAALDRNLPLTASIPVPHAGRQTMWSAFGAPVDGYFGQLAQQIGTDRTADMAERLGVDTHTDAGRTTPLALADAYATIAADGVYCDPLPVMSVTDPDGAPVMTSGATPLDVAAPRCRQAVRAQVARAAVDAARCVTGYGAATAGVCGARSAAARVYRTVGRPVAGGTGTTGDGRAAWFVGFTPALAVAGFLAEPAGRGPGVGRDEPIRSVAATLHDGLAGTGVRDFTGPDPATAYGRRG